MHTYNPLKQQRTDKLEKIAQHVTHTQSPQVEVVVLHGIFILISYCYSLAAVGIT